MLKAYANFWKNYVNFKGKSTVADYWWTVLCNAIITAFLVIVFIISLVVVIATSQDDASMSIFGSIMIVVVIFLILLALWSLATFIPRISLLVRRTRDTGLSPWWCLLLLVRYIAPLLVIPALIGAITSGMFDSMATTDPAYMTGFLSTLLPARTLLNLADWGVAIFFFIVSLMPSKKQESKK